MGTKRISPFALHGMSSNFFRSSCSRQSESLVQGNKPPLQATGSEALARLQVVENGDYGSTTTKRSRFPSPEQGVQHKPITEARCEAHGSAAHKETGKVERYSKHTTSRCPRAGRLSLVMDQQVLCYGCQPARRKCPSLLGQPFFQAHHPEKTLEKLEAYRIFSPKKMAP